MHGVVQQSSWLTPSLMRVVIGGPGLDGFSMTDGTDTYVNVAIPTPDDAPMAPSSIQPMSGSTTSGSTGRPVGATPSGAGIRRPAS